MDIDHKYNGVVRQAYDHIGAMATSESSLTLASGYSFACGYIQALFDIKAIPQKAFENLLNQAREGRDQIAERNKWQPLAWRKIG